MAKELNQDTIPTFRKKFATLHDAVIQRITYDTSQRSQTLEVKLATWSLESEGAKGVILYIKFLDVQTLVIKSFPAYAFAIIFESNYAYLDYSSLVAFDFKTGRSSSVSEDFREYNDGASEFLVKAKKCVWWIEDLPPSDKS